MSFFVNSQVGIIFERAGKGEIDTYGRGQMAHSLKFNVIPPFSQVIESKTSVMIAFFSSLVFHLNPDAPV
jgi:hypothetical protein